MLPPPFYARPARQVAVDLLGKRLVRRIGSQRVSGIIVETEAYCDTPDPDLACHATKNKGQPTKRTAVMFGQAGNAYVYFTYGNHWMFNVVTGQTGQANGVLIRALQPEEGETIIAGNRSNRPRSQWTNGPGKLTQAFQIDHQFNGYSLCQPDGHLWLENGQSISPNQINTGPRVGMGKTPEPWFSMPWRYWIRDNPFISAYR